MTAATRYTSQFIASLKQKSIEAASKFPDYNFRAYFQRITTEDFQILSALKPEDKQFTPLIQRLEERCEMMERQAVVQSLYRSRTSFMDNPEGEMETHSPASKKTLDEDESV